MATPVVGITVPAPADPRYDNYRRALREVGAEAVDLAPGAAIDLDGLDGILFPGGGDVDPARYGEEMNGSGPPNPELDALELDLVARARERRLPILGICRGHQVVNVALGGSLHQDLFGHAYPYPDHPRDHVAHQVRVEPGTRLAAMADSEWIDVNSRHHQAVKTVAPGLRVSAVSPDGVVEGMESEDGLVMTLQCHPENLAPGGGWSRRLFQEWVAGL